MLDPEAAKEQLEKWQVSQEADGNGNADRWLSAVKKLPKKPREVGFALLGKDKSGKDHTGFMDFLASYRQLPGEGLETLTKAERTKLFRTFFGKFAGDVELGWQWLKSAPYSAGYYHRPFRAAKLPNLSSKRRAAWVHSMIALAGGFRDDVLTAPWLAAWSPYIQIGWQNYNAEVGTLLAAKMDAGGKEGDEVFEILCASARKEHEIGGMGEHVIRGLLCASRPEGWELMQNMLRAAQRQEGLRQSILQTVVDAHPQAFRQMLRLIVDEGLSRFSSVVMAMDGWFSLAWASAATKKVNDTISIVADLLEEPAKCQQALAGSDPERAYLALWAIAFEDAPASVKPAEKLLAHKNVEMRFVAALHLSHLEIPATGSALIKALDDDDLRVALIALTGPMHDEFDDEGKTGTLGDERMFVALERLYERMPEKPKLLKPLVWPWLEITAQRGFVASLLVSSLGTLPPTRLIPHLKQLDPANRSRIVTTLAEQKTWDPQTRTAILEHVGDASPDVRSVAFEAYKNTKLKPAETKHLEALLTRTAVDLRSGIVSLLLTLPDKQAMESAARLMAAKQKGQRLAGLEVLRQLAEADRRRTECIKTVQTWVEERGKVLKAEQVQVDAILESNRETVTLDDALGLIDPQRRTPVIPAKKRNVKCVTAAVPKLLKSLDDLVHQHRETNVQYKSWNGEEQEALLGELDYGFPSPDFDRPAKQQIDELPLHKVWEEWFRKRPAALKDKDGFELLRAWGLMGSRTYWRNEYMLQWLNATPERKPLATFVGGKTKFPKLKYSSVVNDVVRWLVVLHLPKKAIDFCLDAIETIETLIPPEDMEAIRLDPEKTEVDPYSDSETDWRDMDFTASWIVLIRLIGNQSVKLPKKQSQRYWQMLRRRDEPFPGVRRDRPDFSELAEAYCAGHATIEDVGDHLLGSRESSRWNNGYGSLSEITARFPGVYLRAFLQRPEVAEFVQRVRERLLEIELGRGEAATPSSEAALSANYRGTETLLRLLTALGKEGFKKLSGWRSEPKESRPATFTEMVAKTWPADDDTPEQFAVTMKRAIKEGHFPEERLLQLGFLAPQWTEFIDATLKWAGYAEGFYWYMAHMKYVYGVTDSMEVEDAQETDAEGADEEGNERPQKLSRWDRIIRERTPLSDDERADGAIDVAWFHRTYKQITRRRWLDLAAAAKFAATAAQARRAQFISDVLLGTASKKDLVEGIKKRNLKENVRLLGLLPLAKGAKQAKDIVDRYEVLQEYRRYANKLSSLSKPDALRACDIGMQNLAATAGYDDPTRLQWAMEAESTKDLAKGPIVVSQGDVSLTLSLDDQAVPELVIRRSEKVLKSLPNTVKKDAKFVELRERNKHLKRQASRVKQSLETAMCRGDEFTGSELLQFADHALLWPQLSRLVLVGEGCIGYPDKRGKAVRDFAGKLEPVKKKERFRIAHPHDLLLTSAWDKWQHECFQTERLQPFKQVFRELYVVTKQEKKEKTISNRYAGQQVQPRQAYALWGTRGWSADAYEGVWKTYYHEEIIANVSFDDGITTPLEVEGLTIDQISFRNRDTYESLPLVDVPARLFSETMRDMDLVVSVAHAGDVDPEASASTVEMRASLLQETCELFSLKNVKIKNSKAIIQGKFGQYALHLGSGVVHRMPGGSVCIVPVHSQHRGRLFLPFADDDPRTAEVVSKTLLLARDEEIDDPIILEQLRALA
ncbi:hypothetical protein CA54_09480 [Symmachiella macrocystis]|uniref:DUF4132 domain-containing protein n=1 Tax=Symmachiella macrocystis TaxID=2527985 RepID=A0A5C6BJE6_9PLAN|nr:DUF5724 domain-containing protein [Symmachiella macrocystis]TWU12130.1 hypothetical protein CA54_09480 [Symmachiella macrocystis]